MITFFFLLTNPDSFILKRSLNEYGTNYPEILDVCGEFKILIDEEVYLSEPQFPIVEFIVFLDTWIQSKNKTQNMLYNSIETEDNPLICLTKKNQKWLIRSPWQKYECNITFSRDELETAVFNLKQSVDEQLGK